MNTPTGSCESENVGEGANHPVLEGLELSMVDGALVLNDKNGTAIPPKELIGDSGIGQEYLEGGLAISEKLEELGLKFHKALYSSMNWMNDIEGITGIDVPEENNEPLYTSQNRSMDSSKILKIGLYREVSTFLCQGNSYLEDSFSRFLSTNHILFLKNSGEIFKFDVNQDDKYISGTYDLFEIDRCLVLGKSERMIGGKESTESTIALIDGEGNFLSSEIQPYSFDLSENPIGGYRERVYKHSDEKISQDFANKVVKTLMSE